MTDINNKDEEYFMELLGLHKKVYQNDFTQNLECANIIRKHIIEKFEKLGPSLSKEEKERLSRYMLSMQDKHT